MYQFSTTDIRPSNVMLHSFTSVNCIMPGLQGATVVYANVIKPYVVPLLGLGKTTHVPATQTSTSTTYTSDTGRKVE